MERFLDVEQSSQSSQHQSSRQKDDKWGDTHFVVLIEWIPAAVPRICSYRSDPVIQWMDKTFPIWWIKGLVPWRGKWLANGGLIHLLFIGGKKNPAKPNNYIWIFSVAKATCTDQPSIFAKQRKLQLWRRSVAHVGLATIAVSFRKHEHLLHLENLVL